VAQQLLTVFGHPISAPSANMSGHVSPTTAQHVADEFGDELQIIDGGPCEKGIESTVISMVESPTVLRFGSITVEELQREIGDVMEGQTQEQSNSPGTSTRHYAPNTKVLLYTQQQVVSADLTNCVVISFSSPHPNTSNHIQMPSSACEYAKQLYAVLREADGMGVHQIIVERPPETPEWKAVNDRLRRCCTRD
ncbi:MAG: Sua5/YciO/YrdC/YwlC family protein, partial [Planctomycetes bacterium]|nr:Sua5/YciO/YrdC/YwlC family protein [Planctomycetota bacterium]